MAGKRLLHSFCKDPIYISFHIHIGYLHIVVTSPSRTSSSRIYHCAVPAGN